VWEGGERLVSGSLLGHESPRVVQIGSFYLDARPEGTALIMGIRDVPGVIGRVGTLLGKYNINIAEWRMGRFAAGQDALSFLNLDTPASPEVLAELVKLEGVSNVRQVNL
jgi:D-3-phosphoglycerate dehydrogenase